MKNNKIGKVLKKEIVSVFRDKKSLAMMLIIPLIIPLIIIGMSALFDAQMSEDAGDNYNKIGFSYELSAKEQEILTSLNIETTVDTEDNLKEKINNDEVYLYITKNENKYTLNYNMSSDKGGYASSLANNYLSIYKEYLQTEKLSSNNINPTDILNIIEIKETDLNTESYFANYIISYAFMFILMAITVSATYPATDSTAGEKERGTLETLLTFPIKSRDIIIGKLLGVTTSSIVTGVLSLILALLSFQFINNTYSIYESIPVTMSIPAILISIIIIIMYSLFISGLSIAIASMSKTFKEAQSALTPLTFLAMFPGMIAFMVGIPTTTLYSIIPFLNFSMIFSDTSAGNINIINIALMITSTIIYIVVVIWYIIKEYKSEKVLFGK
jgi:sodium transport system permease protein